MNWLNYYYNRRAYAYLNHCPKILDIGCGTGEFIRFNPRKIIGLDSNPQIIKLCRQQGFKVKLGSATKLPFKSNSFQGIHCSHLIEHLPPKQVHQVLSQISRVLKSGGLLVIRSPLLWSGFYYNLTHLKPYPPQAITRYLVEHAPDTSLPDIKQKFTQLALHWRYNFKTLERTGYTLVLKKL